MANIKEQYNILLLGQTGVGKSTFINSFANYVNFPTLKDAQQGKLACLIPAKFVVTNDENQQITVLFGADNNEDKKVGNSSTQATKSYRFPFIDKRWIRLIDTPGMGDARGAEKDRENLENILDFIARSIQHLHAICFLFKPNITVIDPYFKFCVMELLSHLDRSACNNIMFLFTNTRGTDYKAVDTLANIKTILDELKQQENVTIPLNYTADVENNNVFCFDNEGFKYLVAQEQGASYGNEAIMKSSWETSWKSSWQFLNNVIGTDTKKPIPPHLVQKTVSLNNARKHIINLSKPLADCTELIQDNLDALRIHKAKVLESNISIEDLTNNLYVPIIDISQKTLSEPVTICTSNKCSEVVTVLGVMKHHYKQRCHNPCYLTNVPRQIVGSPELVHCAAMNGTKSCQFCKCDFSTHMHIYYETTLTETKAEDESIKKLLATNKDKLEAQYELIKKMELTADNYKKEHEVISQVMAKFAYFLKTNSICPVNDAYEEYLEYLIRRARLVGGCADHVRRYTQLKNEHIEQKKIIENSAKKAKDSSKNGISADDINKLIKTLYSLPLMGSKIQALHARMGSAIDKECNQPEYVHKNIVKRPILDAKMSRSDIGATSKNSVEDIVNLLQAGKFDEATSLIENLKTKKDEASDIDKILQTMQELKANQKSKQENKGNTPRGRKNFQPNRSQYKQPFVPPHVNVRAPPPTTGNFIPPLMGNAPGQTRIFYNQSQNVSTPMAAPFNQGLPQYNQSQQQYSQLPPQYNQPQAHYNQPQPQFNQQHPQYNNPQVPFNSQLQPNFNQPQLQQGAPANLTFNINVPSTSGANNDSGKADNGNRDVFNAPPPYEAVVNNSGRGRNTGRQNYRGNRGGGRGAAQVHGRQGGVFKKTKPPNKVNQNSSGNESPTKANLLQMMHKKEEEEKKQKQANEEKKQKQANEEKKRKQAEEDKKRKEMQAFLDQQRRIVHQEETRPRTVVPTPAAEPRENDVVTKLLNMLRKL